MSLVIGCPVFKRSWIIQEWYLCAVEAAERARLDPVFLFVGDPVADAETFAAYESVSRHETIVEIVEEQAGLSGSRDWHPARYTRMVFLRNKLLSVVREMDPRYFLSLDSDILLHSHALESMVTNLEQRGWGAIGARTYMDATSRCYPSYAQRTRSGLRREDSEGTFTVDVIMAIKLMTRLAYWVDYEYSHQGEDIGWSVAARRAGISLGWDGKFCSKHIMSPDHKERIDQRAGW